MSELARYERQGRIARITMDDGKVNALSIPMLRTLHAALDQAQREQAVVVLTGRDGYLSAGFDLKVFASGDGAAVQEMLMLGATLNERLLGFATPVLIACSGHGVAAGAFLLLCADMRIGAAGGFQIGLNEVRIGLTVPWFVIELARQRLPPAHFDRTVVNAAVYGPEEAIAAGFLDRVVPADQLEDAALEAANDLATLNADAHAATKLRARGAALKAVRAAIEGELSPENFNPAP